MEEKEIIKILEKAIKNFNEGKNKAGINVVRKFYSQLVEKRDEEIRRDNAAYEWLVKHLIVGQEISASDMQRWTTRGYLWTVEALKKLKKEGKIEKIKRKDKYKVLVGKTKEEYQEEKLQEFMKELKPYVPHSYTYPTLDSFDCQEPELIKNEEEIEEAKNTIIAVFADFKIKVLEIECVSFGYTVTKYKLKFDSNVSLKKVLNYDVDVAWRLARYSVYMYTNSDENCVYIEVPNKEKFKVNFAHMLKDDAFVNAKPNSIMFAMGKDTDNRNIYGDLTKMVHLLVSGCTGSGKSVFLHSLIFSLIYKYSPEDLRLILIDPKQVEFTIYKDIPHLLVNEIINDTTKAVRSLDWAIYEMNRRYSLFEKLGRCGKYVTNIDQFNEQIEGTERLPKIVIVIDEFADLMLTSKKAIESCVLSLAQKSRAAGIHIVIATQRPSADVLTGPIKCNLPTRICLKTNEVVDSKLILGQPGAQKLLGNGDFLYVSPMNNIPIRVQAPFVSFNEINQMVDFIKSNNESSYTDEEADKIIQEQGNKDDNVEPLFIEALRLTIQNDSASISFLQRKLDIGYARAGGIVDWMEHMGYVSPFDGAKSRRVYITKEEFESKYGPL